MECLSSTDCVTDVTKPFCDRTEAICKKCNDAPDPNGECTLYGEGNLPFCDPKGSGKCVECLQQLDCVGANPQTPFCNDVTATCEGCYASPLGGNQFCALADPINPVCAPAETPAVGGSCVQCVKDQDCVANGLGNKCSSGNICSGPLPGKKKILFNTQPRARTKILGRLFS